MENDAYANFLGSIRGSETRRGYTRNLRKFLSLIPDRIFTKCTGAAPESRGVEDLADSFRAPCQKRHRRRQVHNQVVREGDQQGGGAGPAQRQHGPKQDKADKGAAGFKRGRRLVGADKQDVSAGDKERGPRVHQRGDPGDAGTLYGHNRQAHHFDVLVWRVQAGGLGLLLLEGRYHVSRDFGHLYQLCRRHGTQGRGLEGVPRGPGGVLDVSHAGGLQGPRAIQKGMALEVSAPAKRRRPAPRVGQV